MSVSERKELEVSIVDSGEVENRAVTGRAVELIADKFLRLRAIPGAASLGHYDLSTCIDVFKLSRDDKSAERATLRLVGQDPGVLPDAVQSEVALVFA